jgi:hypothetical protein
LAQRTGDHGQVSVVQQAAVEGLVKRFGVKANGRLRAKAATLLPADQAAKVAGELLSTIRGQGPRWMPENPSDPLVHRAILGPPIQAK